MWKVSYIHLISSFFNFQCHQNYLLPVIFFIKQREKKKYNQKPSAFRIQELFFLLLEEKFRRSFNSDLDRGVTFSSCLINNYFHMGNWCHTWYHPMLTFTCTVSHFNLESIFGFVEYHSFERMLDLCFSRQ